MTVDRGDWDWVYRQVHIRGNKVKYDDDPQVTTPTQAMKLLKRFPQ